MALMGLHSTTSISNLKTNAELKKVWCTFLWIKKMRHKRAENDKMLFYIFDACFFYHEMDTLFNLFKTFKSTIVYSRKRISR